MDFQLIIINMFEFIRTTISEQINSNQFLSGGLILGAMTTVLYSLKSVPLWLWDRIKRRFYYEVTIEQDSDLYRYVQTWVKENHAHEFRRIKVWFFREKRSDYYGNQRPPNKLLIDQLQDNFTLFRNYRIITFSNQRSRVDNASSLDHLFYSHYTVGGILAKKSILGLLEEISKYNIQQEAKTKNPNLYTNSEYEWDRHEIRFRNLKNIVISQKDDIVRELKSFLENKEFYMKKDIPYRIGMLLEGPPGTGKSSFVSALAKHFMLDLYVMNLKSYSSEIQFQRCMDEIKSNSILLIEDIDGYFTGRETKTKISFSTFINAISGVRSKSDTILIITTNKKEVLDEALLRSGRIDKKYTISYPTLKEVNEYVGMFFDVESNISYLPPNTSMADIENICVKNKFSYDEAIREFTTTVVKSLV